MVELRDTLKLDRIAWNMRTAFRDVCEGDGDIVTRFAIYHNRIDNLIDELVVLKNDLCMKASE
jgi:hypothetical protein